MAELIIALSDILGRNMRLHHYAPITIFTLIITPTIMVTRKERMKMYFGDRLKKEREKRQWSQVELAEKIHVSRQSVSKWETGKNYPSIEVIIDLSDLLGITIDELLRSDEELKEKVIQDSKQLAHPRWKSFFDSLFLLGAFLLLVKLIILGLNYFAGTDFFAMDGKAFKITANLLPIVMMIIGGIGSDSLKDKHVS